MECPECGQEIGKAKYCGCGWRGKNSGKGAQRATLVAPEGYPQCEWVTNGVKCRYPGTCSHSVHGAGPWFCSAHLDCSDPVLGAQIVEQSQKFVYKTEAMRAKEAQAKGDAKCAELGLTTTEEKRAWVLEQVGLLADKWKPDYLKGEVPMRREREPGDDDEVIR